MSNPADLSKSIRKARGWSQDRLAEELMVSRNYISLIEGGREPSVRLMTQLTKLAAENRQLTGTRSGSENAVLAARADEDTSPYGDAATLRAEAERTLKRVLNAAGTNRQRLAWISEQLSIHLLGPAESWVVSQEEQEEAERMAAQMTEARRRRERGEASPEQATG